LITTSSNRLPLTDFLLSEAFSHKNPLGCPLQEWLHAA
jgi:hypothetical protein